MQGVFSKIIFHFLNYDTIFYIFVETYTIVTEDENGQNILQVPYHYADRLVTSATVQMSATKARRLAQEIATLSTSLPLSPSSSVFVRCDEEQLDVMKVCAFRNYNVSNYYAYTHYRCLLLDQMIHHMQMVVSCATCSSRSSTPTNQCW